MGERTQAEKQTFGSVQFPEGIMELDEKRINWLID